MKAADKEWFVHDRFGMFIHWGVYALPARHEWVKQRECMPDESYDRYLKYFDPDLYDPGEWAAAAEKAGMKYFVITTKHHDGFCLWDSKLTDYKAPNTPAGRDLVRPMVEAFRKRGLRAGFYHSLIDWHHPDFLIDDIHPLRNSPERTELNKNRDQKKYIDYLHGQVEELLTGYGKIDLIFFDYSYPPGKRGRPADYDGKGKDDWNSRELVKMARELQPGIIVNDRLDLDGDWDLKTPEQYQVREWVKVDGKPVTWEACHTFSGSWGYHRDEYSWKSEDMLIRMLIDSVSKGGNLLLNVGPTARGEFDGRALEKLSGVGRWMRRHKDSIYGCTQAPAGFPVPEDCRLTFHPGKNRIYVHVFSWPFKYLHLDGFAGRVEYAQLLNDDSELRMFEGMSASRGEQAGWETLTLEMPVEKPEAAVPVVELFLSSSERGKEI